MSIDPTARLAYRAGLSVLPVANDGSKRPAVSTWRAYQKNRPTPAEMRGFAFDAKCGLGMVAGPASGHRECWDFDHLETFEAFVAAADTCGLAALVKRIRDGYEDATPGGGRRWIVTYPASIAWRDCTLARRPGRDGEPNVKTLIELPTFAILAPSNGQTHPTGKPYVRLSGGFDTIACYSAEERDELMELARVFDAMPRRASRTPKAPRSGTGARPGDVFAAQNNWDAILEPAGWTAVYTRDDVTFWRRPGKQVGISANTNYRGSDLLYVFTSSTAFDADTSYTKFGAYAVLHHDGDFAAAARALSADGTPTVSRATTRPVSPAPASAASWRWLRDVPREFVSWLWPSRLALGTLALWIGDGGLGKSRASNDVAARVTTGALWPDGEAAEVGTVIILSAEDSASYTIKPAIEAAGGDVSKVAVLDAVRDEQGHERTFQLGTDLAALEELLDATNARLIIIDPLSAYFGTTLDSYRDTDVRSVLEPVVKLAERRRVAVLGIMHIGKGADRSARHRALGSVAFVNAARLVFAVGADPEDSTRRLLVPVKANLCREAAPLAFRLEDADGVARVVWDEGRVAEVNADLVLNGKPVSSDVDANDAEAVVRELMEEEDWPLDAKTALDAGRARGIHERTMRRAASKLGIRIRKVGFRGHWRWHLPAEADTEAAGTSAMSASRVLSFSTRPKGTVSSSPSSQEVQQNEPIDEEDKSLSTRAREQNSLLAGDDLPASLTEPTDPDRSDPIGGHDEETES